jgi:hypothetical protein
MPYLLKRIDTVSISRKPQMIPEIIFGGIHKKFRKERPGSFF